MKFQTTAAECALLLIGLRRSKTRVASCQNPLPCHAPRQFYRGLTHSLRMVLWLLHWRTPGTGSKIWDLLQAELLECCALAAARYLGHGFTPKLARTAGLRTPHAHPDAWATRRPIGVPGGQRWLAERFFPNGDRPDFYRGALVGLNLAIQAIRRHPDPDRRLARTVLILSDWARFAAQRVANNEQRVANG